MVWYQSDEELHSGSQASQWNMIHFTCFRYVFFAMKSSQLAMFEYRVGKMPTWWLQDRVNQDIEACEREARHTAGSRDWDEISSKIWDFSDDLNVNLGSSSAKLHFHCGCWWSYSNFWNIQYHSAYFYDFHIHFGWWKSSLWFVDPPCLITGRAIQPTCVAISTP